MENISQLIQLFQKSAKGTFLEQDRNSNFPKENTIFKTHESHNETDVAKPINQQNGRL